MKNRPPKIFSWLLAIFCPQEKREEVEGDLLEAFYWRMESKSSFNAKAFFIYEVLRSFRIYHFSPFQYLNQLLMTFNMHIKTGWRFLKKNMVYSTMNIAGLALGLSFCLLAWLYVNDETSYDKHLSLHDRLYRVVIDIQHGDNVHHIGGSSNAISQTFKEQIPEIEQVVRLDRSNALIKQGEDYLEKSILVTETQIERFLDLQFISGHDSFKGPNELWVSESLAGLLAIDSQAADATLTMNFGQGDEVFIIKGIYRDIPLNTSVHAELILSFDYYIKHAKPEKLTTWFDVNMNTLVLLRDYVNVAAISTKMNLLHLENNPDMEALVSFRLQPITDTHLDKDYGHYNGIAAGGNTELIWIFSCVGLLALIIAIINYTNFNISLYLNRSREVAVRKIIGSGRGGIFTQLMSESALSVVIAALFASVILLIALPLFGELVSKSYSFSELYNPVFISGAVFILFLIILFTGAYPSIIFSKLSMVHSLKGYPRIGRSKALTQSLMALQFGITALLIIGMIILKSQLKHLQNFDNKIGLDGVLYFEYIPNTDDQTIERFLTDLKAVPGVISASAISGYNGTRMKDESNIIVKHLRIEQDLLTLLDIDIIAGRNFDSLLQSDKTNKVLVNEQFLISAGIDDPIGKTIAFEYGDLKNPQIIGVVENYHFASAKSKVDPLVIYQSEQYPLESAYVKTEKLVNKDVIEALWQKHFSPYPINMVYLEDFYNSSFEQEQRLMKLVGFGAFLSVVLAGLGLLGILGLQLNQKLKEISIRKVLGASFTQLLLSTSQKLIIFISIGTLVGLAGGYFLGHQWLLQYPYAISIHAGIVFLATLIVVSLAAISLFSQVLKTSKANPVKYLKDE
ncbi:MAG: putative ABC transport system permease protein [Cyclobacteriaceae bacterium]|jgi:putative ABC transport system permease protein